MRKQCQGFLTKPVSLSQLVTQLRQFFPSQPQPINANTISLESPPAAVINHKIIDLPELIYKLHNQEIEMPKLIYSMIRRDLRKFVNILKQWGQEHQCNLLFDYCRKLENALESLNITELSKILENFPQIGKALENINKQYS